MGLFSMSSKKKHRSNQGSGYYQPQGFMGKLGGLMGSFSSSDRKRRGYGQQPYPQQGQPMQQPFGQPGQPMQQPYSAQSQPVQAAAPAPASGGSVACPACNAQVPAGSKFCLSCGEKLSSGFCAQCGAAVSPAAKFCPECGTPRA